MSEIGEKLQQQACQKISFSDHELIVPGYIEKQGIKNDRIFF